MDFIYSFIVLLDLPVEIEKKGDRWYKKCPLCQEQQSYLRRNYAIHSFNQGKSCKKCANRMPQNNGHKGCIKGVLRRSFVGKIRTGSILRGICWDVEEEYIANLLIKQNFKCALSGWDISARDNNNTASLDRINSNLGYVEGNLQWVHKMINMCKQRYSQEDFINMCISVCNKNDKVKW